MRANRQSYFTGFRLSQQGMILVCVSLGFELIFIAILMITLSRAQIALMQIEQSKKIIEAVQGAANIVTRYGQLGLVYQFTGASGSTDWISQFQNEQRSQLSLIESLVENDEEESKGVHRLRQTTEEVVDCLNQARGMDAQAAKLEYLFGSGGLRINSLARRAASEVAFIIEIERRRKGDLAAQEAAVQRQVQSVVSAGIPLSILVAAALALYFNKTTRKRLIVLMNNTQGLARRQALLPELCGNDELATLDHRYHDMAARLIEMENQNKQLLALISQDLRSPLTSIKICFDALKENSLGSLPEMAAADIVHASTSVDRLIALTNDLLNIERLEAGKLELVVAPVSMQRVIEHSIASVSSWAEHRRIEIRTQCEAVSQCFADGDRLEQVLINLLSNALKFSPPQTTITISAQRKDDWLEVRVSDQGPGIPQADKERIFQSFEQIDSGNSKAKGGTGLGLSICQTIIAAHAGKIGVDSEEAKGSTFWFRIPTEAKTDASTS